MSPLLRPALVVIDVQKAFDVWEGRGERRNNPDAVSRIADLLSAFRAATLPVFHIRHRGTSPGSLFQGLALAPKRGLETNPPATIKPEEKTRAIHTHLA